VLGEPSARSEATPYRDAWLHVAPIAGLLALVLLLGVWIPEPLLGLLKQAAPALEPAP